MPERDDDESFLHQPINQSIGERSLAEYLDLYVSFRVTLVFVGAIAISLVLLFTDIGKVDRQADPYPAPTEQFEPTYVEPAVP